MTGLVLACATLATVAAAGGPEDPGHLRLLAIESAAAVHAAPPLAVQTLDDAMLVASEGAAAPSLLAGALHVVTSRSSASSVPSDPSQVAEDGSAAADDLDVVADDLDADDADAVTAATADEPGDGAEQGDDGEEVDASPQPAESALLATVEDLAIHLPVHRPVAVGFHQASRWSSLPLEPAGRSVDLEALRVDPAHDLTGRAEDVPFAVLPARGRGTSRTSAADVVVAPGEAVVSPVDGTVSDVRTYRLYGRHDDHRIEIVPASAPDRRVVLLHVDAPQVQAGDEVVAGTSEVATSARTFPFESQIDRWLAPDRLPHVHVEVQSADPAGPGDP